MPPVLAITIREGTIANIPEIVRQRRRMCEDMNYTDAKALSTMAALTADYLIKAIPEGSFRSWLACDNGRVIAGGAIVITPWPAHAYDLECRRATILNVYTESEYRRRGIARQIMETMIGWCKQEGFARVSLHASEQGRHLYESLGFVDSNEMRLNLR
jgi:GNAT superfamily N-acetyltransferase